MVDGLTSTGLQVMRIGVGPTPMLYFSIYHNKADAGIMVTGSHNPPDQNGFKMFMARRFAEGGPIYGEAIKKLAAMAAKEDFVTGKGAVKNIDVRDAYVDRLMKAYDSPRPLTVVWDCGNGASGEIVERMTKKMPGTQTVLFGEIDGKFPNHDPDPSDEKICAFCRRKCASKRPISALKRRSDGDADDRVIAVDEEGRALLGRSIADDFTPVGCAEIQSRRTGDRGRR